VKRPTVPASVSFPKTVPSNCHSLAPFSSTTFLEVSTRLPACNQWLIVCPAPSLSDGSGVFPGPFQRRLGTECRTSPESQWPASPHPPRTLLFGLTGLLSRRGPQFPLTPLCFMMSSRPPAFALHKSPLSFKTLTCVFESYCVSATCLAWWFVIIMLPFSFCPSAPP